MKDWGAQAIGGAKNWGAQALSGTKNLGGRIVNGAKNWGEQALDGGLLSGAKNLGPRASNFAQNMRIRALNFADQAHYQAKVAAYHFRRGAGVGNEPQLATPHGTMPIGLEPPVAPIARPLMSVAEKPQSVMAKASPEVSLGSTRFANAPESEMVSKVATSETAPKVSTSEPDVGLSNRGYRPQPSERSMTKAEYKTQSSAERNFPGKQHEMNCAPQSCQQIVRASNGRNLTEVEIAASAKASANYDPKTGTVATKVPNVLKAEGVPAKTMPNKPENIQVALTEGKGVISMHDAGKLWGNNAQGGHAVHVTGVKRGPDGKITHYVINDTGTGQVGRQVTAAQYEGSLLKGNAPATVTEKPISYGGSTAKAQRRADAKAQKAAGEDTAPVNKDQSSTSESSKNTIEAKSRTNRDVEDDVSLGAKKPAQGDPEKKSTATSKSNTFAPENFPTPELILPTNNPKTHAGLAGFAKKMSSGANDFKAEFSGRLAEARTPQAREQLMEEAYQWWIQKRRYMEKEGRLPGQENENKKLITDIQPGDPNRDPFGKMAGLKEDGKSTPAYRKREEIGELIIERFRGHDGDVLDNSIKLPKWVADEMGLKSTKVQGNRLIRGKTADEIHSARLQDPKKLPEQQYAYAPGAEKYITQTVEPGNQKILHDAGVKVLSRLVGEGANLRDPKSLKQFSEAAYFFFQGPIKNRGSDSVIRGYMSSIGEQMSGKPVTLPNDVDVQAYARTQEGFSQWLMEILQK
jgi:hypothetical protein